MPPHLQLAKHGVERHQMLIDLYPSRLAPVLDLPLLMMVSLSLIVMMSQNWDVSGIYRIMEELQMSLFQPVGSSNVMLKSQISRQLGLKKLPTKQPRTLLQRKYL